MSDLWDAKGKSTTNVHGAHHGSRGAKPVDPSKRIDTLTTAAAEKATGLPAGRIENLILPNHGIRTVSSLRGLRALRKLDLSHSPELASLSHHAGALDDCALVTFLKVASCALTGEGLAAIRGMPQLKVLNAQGNKLRSIPALQDGEGNRYKVLGALVLNDNELDGEALSFLPKLASLNTLVLSRNRIAAFEKRAFRGLALLTKLSVTHNELAEFPDVRGCAALRELRLAHNKLAAVPAWVPEQLPELKLVDLGSNAIAQWEHVEPLQKLGKVLKQLHLRDNPFSGSYEALEQLRTGAAKSADQEAPTAAELADMPREIRLAASMHKQYCFEMKRRFPLLVIRDGVRKMRKYVHGFKSAQGEGEEEGGGGAPGADGGGSSSSSSGGGSGGGGGVQVGRFAPDGKQGGGAPPASDGKKRKRGAAGAATAATTAAADMLEAAESAASAAPAADAPAPAPAGGGNWLDNMQSEARAKKKSGGGGAGGGGGGGGAALAAAEAAAAAAGDDGDEKKQKKKKSRKEKKRAKEGAEARGEAPAAAAAAPLAAAQQVKAEEKAKKKKKPPPPATTGVLGVVEVGEKKRKKDKKKKEKSEGAAPAAEAPGGFSIQSLLQQTIKPDAW